MSHVRCASVAGLVVAVLASVGAAQEPESHRLSAQERIAKQLGLRFSVAGSKIRRRIISTDTPWGFAVRAVVPGSLAARAGITPGAIVMEVDGVPLREVHELAAILKKKRPGDVLELSCTRRKKRRRLFDRKPWEEFEIELRLPEGKSNRPKSRQHEPKPGDASPRRRRRVF